MANEINIDLGKRRSLKANIGAPGYLGKGDAGTGIESITYKGEDESGGNMYTVLLTDGTSYDITAPKGATGAAGKDGTNGKDGSPGKDGTKWFVSAEVANGEILPVALGAKTDDLCINSVTGEVFSALVGASIGVEEWYSTGLNLKGTKGDKGDKGEPGTAGAAGKDGVTPHIGDNGNWYIGLTDTGKPSRGAAGANGKDGAPGKDYVITTEDKKEIAAAILADGIQAEFMAIPDGTEVAY